MLVFGCLPITLAGAQEDREERVVAFGLNAGLRLGGDVVGQPNWSASIRSTDSTVQIDRLSDRDVLVGVSVSAFPLPQPVRWFGFTANLSLLSLARGWATSRGGLEGGLGFVVRAHRTFALGATVEFFPVRLLRDWVRELDGKPLPGRDGLPMTTIPESDDNLFVSGTHKQLAVWFIWLL